MMKPTEILKHIDEIESQRDYVGRFKTIYALVCTLPDKELMQYVETHGFSEVFMKIIVRRGLKEQFAVRQKSIVSRMLRQLSMPDCKNKTLCREGLKSRYAYVPKAYQQKILHSMLTQGTKKERLWAYTRLGLRWDNSYTQIIERCLAEYQEAECAHLILKHFPTQFVYEHQEEFVRLVGWRWVMSCVGKDYPDIVDREKLTLAEWVHVVVDLHLTDHNADVETFLYHTIATQVDYVMSSGYYRGYSLSLRNFPDVGWAVWAMGQMGMADAILRFQDYDRKFENFVPEDIDDEERADFVYPWLCAVYDTFAVKMLGWPSREEKRYSLEQYHKARNRFMYDAAEEDATGLTDGWFTVENSEV